MPKRKINWKEGDVFAIPMRNGKFNVGQILDRPLPNVARIAIFDEVLNSLTDAQLESLCHKERLISLVECTIEQLDYNEWKILGHKESRPLPIDQYPNEEFRANKWIGSITHDASIIEEFVEAFHGLVFWDDWYNPNFLDSLLIDVRKKPKDLLLKNM